MDGALEIHDRELADRRPTDKWPRAISSSAHQNRSEVLLREHTADGGNSAQLVAK